MLVGGVGNENLANQYTSNLGVEKEVTYTDNTQTLVGTSNLHTEMAKEVSEKDVEETINNVNKLLEKVDVSIQYERHEATNRMMIRLVNKENGDVIKEIPSEKILNLAAFMCEQAGLFVDEKL